MGILYHALFAFRSWLHFRPDIAVKKKEWVLPFWCEDGHLASIYQIGLESFIMTSRMKLSPKIFQIGFNRCGTLCCYNFFHTNNIPSVHWDNGLLSLTMNKNYKQKKPLLNGYENYVFFSDMEHFDENIGVFYSHIHYYRLLDVQYPSSKFILNTRNIDNWINSRLNHRFGGIKGYYANYIMSRLNINLEQLLYKWRLEWTNHHNDVLAHFKVRENDLLIFDIENDDPQKIVYFFRELYDLDKEKFEKSN